LKKSIHFFLNIPSILLVTKYPPTTLIVAKKTAAVPRTVVKKVLSDPDERRAPTIVIPEIAFAPDINGVWSVDGTLFINSKPKKIDKTRTNNNKINKLSIS
jgi:hypothetical protein